MTPYIIQQKDFLNYFNKLSPKNKINFIPTLNKQQINAISEICKKKFK